MKQPMRRGHGRTQPPSGECGHLSRYPPAHVGSEATELSVWVRSLPSCAQQVSALGGETGAAPRPSGLLGAGSGPGAGLPVILTPHCSEAPVSLGSSLSVTLGFLPPRSLFRLCRKELEGSHSRGEEAGEGRGEESPFPCPCSQGSRRNRPQ